MKLQLLLLTVLVITYFEFSCSYVNHKFHSTQLKRQIVPQITTTKPFQLNKLNSKSPLKTPSTTTIVENESKDKAEFEVDVYKTIATVGLAGVFAGILEFIKGPASSIEFVSGYLLELCLSVDNLIVFILLFDSFKVNKSDQDRILSYGILGAVALRGIFVVAGAAAIQSFSQVLGVFALILAYSSYKILFQAEEDEDEVINLRYFM